MTGTSFFMPMEPPTITAQQGNRIGVTQGGKKYVYKNARLLDAQAKLCAHLSRHADGIPACGPLRLSVQWLFPAAGKHKDGDYKTTKPDTDNLQKLLKDCMTREGFWTDDAQVCEEFVGKYWATIPGILVHITPLNQQKQI